MLQEFWRYALPVLAVIVALALTALMRNASPVIRIGIMVVGGAAAATIFVALAPAPKPAASALPPTQAVIGSGCTVFEAPAGVDMKVTPVQDGCVAVVDVSEYRVSVWFSTDNHRDPAFDYGTNTYTLWFPETMQVNLMFTDRRALSPMPPGMHWPVYSVGPTKV